MDVVLEAIDVHKHYLGGTEEVRALDGLSLQVSGGEFVAVMGASGSGKSTLLHLAGGLDTLTSGTLRVDGLNLAELNDTRRTLFRRRRVGIVFQQFNLLPGLTAAENAALPLLVDGSDPRTMEQKVREVIALVHLEPRRRHRPQALSGGEQQRVAIARALVNDPVVVLADEPTGNLDSHHSLEIWELLHRLSRDHGKTIIMVTHEAQAASYADRICVLHDGRLLGEIKPEGAGDAALVAAR